MLANNIFYCMCLICLPLLSSIIIGLGKNFFNKFYAGIIATIFITISCCISWAIFWQYMDNFSTQSLHLQLFTWINFDNLKINLEICINPLISIMLIIITTISSLVHLYSIEYMKNDLGFKRFMSYLGFFTFAMILLVLSNNLVQMFIGWEGVGLASYLLIGFWYEKDSANNAAFKAFIVNRIGDISLILGIAALYSLCDSFDIPVIFSKLTAIKMHNFTLFGNSINCMEIICGLLLFGAMAKSAQIGMHIWLPDAMEGPTPVSALIHAATMVTAGIFLIVRLSPLFVLAPNINIVITVIGMLTAFFAGTVAIVQNDIKKVIAYSTCSQLGYMFIALGFSAYNLAMFHLFTHAFFKSLLFLGAGAIIHAMSNQQNMYKMGGLWKLIPITFVLMIIGNLALTGVPFLSGYYSKDAIMAVVWHNNIFAYSFVILSVFITALYAWRIIMLTFAGNVRADEKTMIHIHEPKMNMLIPLIFLALGSIISGYLGRSLFFDPLFWQQSLFIDKVVNLAMPVTIHSLPFIMSLLGFIVVYWIYNKPYCCENSNKKLKISKLYHFLQNKWYFDKMYMQCLVEPVKKISIFCANIIERTIDHYGPNGVARLLQYSANYLMAKQNKTIVVYIALLALCVLSLFFVFNIIIR